MQDENVSQGGGFEPAVPLSPAERERAIDRYVLAMDNGDRATAAAVLQMALRDPDLDRILNEINHSMASEEQLSPSRLDGRFVRRLISVPRTSPFDGTPALSAFAGAWRSLTMKKPVPVIFAILLALGLYGAVQLLHRGAGPGHLGFPGPWKDVCPLETRVFGQRAWLRGAPAALRVIVTDHRTGDAIESHVTITLQALNAGVPGGQSHSLFSGDADRLGTLDARFRAPRAPAGPYRLQVLVESSLGQDSVSQDVELQDSVQVLLASDKPVYQPGQVIHLRALALDMATRTALAGRGIVFEVEDARGNKVFKQRETLSKFGVASADFEVADEVNEGAFTLRALIASEQDTGESPKQVEKKVRVEHYVLPKFKLELTTDRPYYLPGETVRGVLKAHYFFGRAVSSAQAVVEVNTLDIGVTQLAHLHGMTDTAGAYHFTYRLPKALVGQPFEQGKAVVAFDGSVTDTADQKQTVSMTVPVVPDPVVLALVPERPALVAGIENRLYIAAATPDGQPVVNARVHVAAIPGNPLLTLSEADLNTDGFGLATFSFVPGGGAYSVRVKVTDSKGHTSARDVHLSTGSDGGGIILRPDRSLAKVGDRLVFEALSTRGQGTIYLDIIRDGQTILTSAAEAHRGRAEFSIPATGDMVGTLEVHAYRILPDEQIIRDSRLVIVSPAGDLNVRVTSDRTQYRPGDDALVHLAVTDQRGRPTASVLGMAAVDESVFAVSDLQPGLEKIYFTLEKELMTPKYEINGLSPEKLLLPVSRPDAARLEGADRSRQRAAAMLLAAAPAPVDFDFKVDTYSERLAKFRAEVSAEIAAAGSRIFDAVETYNARHHALLTASQSLYTLVEQGDLRRRDLLDRWGRPYRSSVTGAMTYEGYFTLSSAGPDGRWGTADDFLVPVYAGPIAGAGFPGAPMAGAKMEAAAMAPARPKPVTSGVPVYGLQQQRSAQVFYPPTPPVYFDDHARRSPAEGSAPAAPRIRQYFPETMYWNPAIITDDAGRATVRLPLADSITSWRLSLLANSVRGQLGSAEASLRVFQDFFVDMDLPVSLTQHDHAAIPVTVYNYLPIAQTVSLTLKQESWFSLTGPATQKLTIGPSQVKVVYYPMVVRSIGKFTLTVTAMGSQLSDAVRRPIEVRPDGKEMNMSISDRLDGQIQRTVVLPADAVPGASTIFVKLFPGAFSQVVDGLDAMLQMPSGCFEQTSSTTYPDVLVLNYLKATRHLNPDLRMKAEEYINVGYQRLLTFECKHGGFSWFGNDPANQVLTAYGLLEFADMAKVHDVDPAVIARTQQWLASRQRPDGSWLPDSGGIEEGIITRQTGGLRTTAYVAWALGESGYQGPALERGVAYVENHLGDARDPYSLAVALNMLAAVHPGGSAASAAAGRLVALAKTSAKDAYWTGDTPTFTGARGSGADAEATGLAAYALLRWNHDGAFTTKVLTHLVRTRDSSGAWGTTQGTVWAMKALLYASGHAAGEASGVATVLANGAPAASFQVSADNSDVMRQVDLKARVHAGANTVTLRFQGEGSLTYQIVGRYYLPWRLVGRSAGSGGPLSLSVAYDKRRLARDDTATVTVTVRNRSAQTAAMPLIDIGIPPGFTVIPDRLDAAVRSGQISKYSITPRQVIVYLSEIRAGRTITLRYAVKARFPVRALTPSSKVYPYYNPELATASPPQDVTVIM